MLWTITVILLVLWVLGLVSGSTMGAWVHILLLLAVQREFRLQALATGLLLLFTMMLLRTVAGSPSVMDVMPWLDSVPPVGGGWSCA